MFNARVGPLGKTWTKKGGKLYGARADKRGPLGGGKRYKGMVAPAEARVCTLEELLDALTHARKGDTVFIDAEAEIDCTERVYVEQMLLEIPAGVTLASDRGHRGSKGGLLRSDCFATKPLLRAVGPGVRVTGLRLRGPNPKPCLEHHRRSFKEGRGHEYYYKFPTSDGIQTEHVDLEVDNCELAGWSHAAVFLMNGDGHHIHHNFIHHNQYNGLGYGVCHGEAASLIECNLLNYNRHSIAATGKPGCAYEARNNVELGHSLSHCFDMHGGTDRKDGTNIAGTWMKVHHNTFRAKRPAVVIRGVPQQKAIVHDNWFAQTRRHPVITERPFRRDAAVSAIGNTRLRDNIYGRTAPRVLKGD